MHRGLVLSALALLTAACQQQAAASEKISRAPVATELAKEPAGLKTAIFAGGCFWGVEGVFSHVKGVTSAVSGYHGGNAADADYQSVSSGRTRHAEAVRVTYDPAKVRYDQLLQILFSVIADPTLKNRQGPDVGAQYRAAIIPLDAEQRRVASAYLTQLGNSGLWPRPIATRIEPYRKFYKAEAHHQDFMAANPRHPYIRAWDEPKVRGLKVLFPDLYRATFQPG